ncbi:MAG: hypothetical protein U0821_18800 [Chloroflexota bacterium]
MAVRWAARPLRGGTGGANAGQTLQTYRCIACGGTVRQYRPLPRNGYCTCRPCERLVGEHLSAYHDAVGHDPTAPNASASRDRLFNRVYSQPDAFRAAYMFAVARRARMEASA